MRRFIGRVGTAAGTVGDATVEELMVASDDDDDAGLTGYAPIGPETSGDCMTGGELGGDGKTRPLMMYRRAVAA